LKAGTAQYIPLQPWNRNNVGGGAEDNQNHSMELSRCVKDRTPAPFYQGFTLYPSIIAQSSAMSASNAMNEKLEHSCSRQ
jgi:hypothetical protein